jgi:hypothetical protein
MPRKYARLDSWLYEYHLIREKKKKIDRKRQRERKRERERERDRERPFSANVKTNATPTRVSVKESSHRGGDLLRERAQRE